jgi:hypothetical protein
MTFALAWLVFPLVLVLVSVGCGLLLESGSGLELPRPLLLPAGFVVVSLTTQFAHMSDATAGLATPLVVALAIVGFGLGWPIRPQREDGWALAGAGGAFAAFAAPVVLTGGATFLGYIKLDDTANYMAMLDRALHYGYNTVGLPPSTYEAFLGNTYTPGYPLGSLLPLGVGHNLVQVDALWLWQPYLTFLAALLALTLYQLTRSIVRSAPARALIAAVGAQAALIYGYAAWGGIKELSTALIVVMLIVLVTSLEPAVRVRPLLPLAVASAGLLGVLSVAGAVWLAPPLAAAAVLSVRSIGLRSTARSAGLFVLTTTVLSIPAILAATTWIGKYAGDYTSGNQYGNLRGTLSWLQVFGIWPTGDFRFRPDDLLPTHVLVAVVVVFIAVAVHAAWRRHSWAIPLAVLTAGFASAFYVLTTAPWIESKALASSSPILLTASLAGITAVFERGRRAEALVAAAAVVAGVMWSNVLQYRAVELAPYERLAEFEKVGERFGGQGPTLLTEFESYGARHFLRTMATEAPGELRRRVIPLRTGSGAGTGESPDLDEIQLAEVLHYRTLVVRISGVASRPPSPYSLAWKGTFYSVWQRPATNGPRVIEHLPLGSRTQPAAVPACAEVLRLGRLAAASGAVLATVRRRPAVVLYPDGSQGAPMAIGQYGEDPRAVYVIVRQSIRLPFELPRAGRYGVWVGGTFRTRVGAYVDDRYVGTLSRELTWPGNFLLAGDLLLPPGSHTLRIDYSGPDLRPGGDGRPGWGIGPFAIANGTQDRPVEYLRPASARSLCGKSLDWIEVVAR